MCVLKYVFRINRPSFSTTTTFAYVMKRAADNEYADIIYNMTWMKREWFL